MRNANFRAAGLACSLSATQVAYTSVTIHPRNFVGSGSLSISDAQFETWSHPGAQTTAAATGQAIRDALNGPASLVRGRDKAIYLQGSYKNSTNIRGDSDVDVVVQLRESLGYDISTLNPNERGAFDREYSPATYTLTQFRADVLSTLQTSFGSRVRSGNKAIFVAKRPGLVDADVMACQTHRFFGGTTTGITVPFHMDGMQFFTQSDHRRIINWPRNHYDKGVEKNTATNGYYKSTVRIFKNLRNSLYDQDAIATASAPSYFVESLIYNVPNSEFGTSHKGNALSALLWLYNEHEQGRFQNLVCGNGFLSLFGATPEQWDIPLAYNFVTACMHACVA